MIISMLQENMIKALKILYPAMDKRPYLPVLNNILLKTEDARLRISATDLEHCVTVWIGAKVEQEGEITLPAKTLMDIVKNFAPERIDMQLIHETLDVHIKCGNSEVTLHGIDAAEFPAVKEEDRECDALVPAALFKRLLKKSLFAVAREDNRPILTGLNLDFDKKNKTMKVVSADGYRGCFAKVKLGDSDLFLNGEYVIPAKTLKIIHDIIDVKEDDFVKLWWDAYTEVMTFGLRSVQVRVRHLEGRFPDFEAIIPRSWTTSATFFRTDLLKVLERALPFAKDNAGSVKLGIKVSKMYGEPSKAVINSKSMERGVFEACIDVSAEGDHVSFSFNITYMIEVLKALAIAKVDDDRVVLETNGEYAPVTVRHMNTGEFYANTVDWLSVIMPMSTGR